MLYWGIATSYSLFGVNEAAARLIPALSALLGLAMAFLLGRRMFGLRAGLLSALILATSLMWPLAARVVVTDMLVSSLVFTALALWWLGHTASEPQRGRCFLLFWAVLGLGVLAKGPIEIVLTGGTIFLYLNGVPSVAGVAPDALGLGPAAAAGDCGSLVRAGGAAQP